MDLNEIIVFIKVVEAKSFTGAAEQLGLPKSTVSRRLAQLEERLGVRLLQRTTRRLALTDAGQAYYERCARIVAEIALAEQQVADMQTAPRGLLRITAPVDLSTTCLGTILAAFSSEFPDVTIELDASNQLVDLLEDGYDLGIRFGPLHESTLTARRLCRSEMFLVASPAYLLRRNAPVNIDDLDDHDRVLFTPVSRMQSWEIQNEAGESFEMARPAKFVSNNLSAVRHVLLSGGGIGLMPDFFVVDDLKDGTLVRVLPEWSRKSNEIFAVYPGRQNLSPKLQVFITHLLRSFNPPPWASIA